jgi:putative ABC transport system permease protein
MPISTPWSVIITALAMSTTVGLFFGIYPAVRASRLDPIVALRAE